MSEDDDWDGEWWSESLEGRDRERYAALMAKLSTAKPEELSAIGREIFQFGHEHGYELAGDLMHQD